MQDSAGEVTGAQLRSPARRRVAFEVPGVSPAGTAPCFVKLLDHGGLDQVHGIEGQSSDRHSMVFLWLSAVLFAE